MQGKRVRVEVHKPDGVGAKEGGTLVHNSGGVGAMEEGTFVEGTRGSVSRNTAARVGKASQIGVAEIGQAP